MCASFLESVISDRINHLGRIGTFLRQSQESALRSRRQDSLANVNRAIEHNGALMEEAAGMYYLSIAIGKLYSILGALSLIHVPPRPFSNAQLRYELRMKPFLSLSIPQIMSYEEFEKRSTIGLKRPKDLIAGLQVVDNAVREAKKQFALLQKRPAEHMRVLSVSEKWNKRWVAPSLMACIATGIAIATLQKVQKTHCQSNIRDLKRLLEVHIPAVEERYHEWWIVPKVSEVK